MRFFRILTAALTVLRQRFHRDHPVFTELPFDNGDVSYGLAYEYHESAAYWHLGLDYAPSVSGTNNVDYVLTPDLSLVFTDNLWRLGAGILDSYKESDFEQDKGWTGIYWQLIFGINVPVAGLKFDLFGYYTFKDWSDLNHFDTIEFGVWMSYFF